MYGKDQESDRAHVTETDNLEEQEGRLEVEEEDEIEEEQQGRLEIEGEGEEKIEEKQEEYQVEEQQGRLEGGEVLISEFLYERIKDRFEIEDAGEISLKGKAKPVHTYRVLKVKDEE